MNKEEQIVWSKSQMFDALRTYQTGLGEIQQHVDDLVSTARKQGLTPEMRMFLDQILATIVNTTVNVAEDLGE